MVWAPRSFSLFSRPPRHFPARYPPSGQPIGTYAGPHLLTGGSVRLHRMRPTTSTMGVPPAQRSDGQRLGKCLQLAGGTFGDVVGAASYEAECAARGRAGPRKRILV